MCQNNIVMSTLSRKQREIKEREELILDTARPLLIEQGYHGLSMDRIAETLQYSKGTIYNHFSCKEEIIIALAIQTTEKRLGLFERAAAFHGNSRERIQAIGTAAALFVQLFPAHFKIELTIRMGSIWEKASEERRMVMRTCESRCTGVVGGIVRDAISQKDLDLPDGVAAEDLVFGLWSICFGAFSIITTSDQLVSLGIRDPFDAFRLNVNKMLDGYGWKPSSDDYDLHATQIRIQKEVFPDEYRSIEA